MIVADASVLVVLAKTKRLDLLRKVYGRVMVGAVVKNEVVDKGKEILAAGVEQVEKALEDGWIEVAELTSKEKKLMQGILKTSRLDQGEAESLALAHARGLMLIVDDKEGRSLAAAMHLEYLGTMAAILEAFIKGHLTLDQLEDAVQEMSKILWLSPAVVAEILKRAREARK